MGLGWQGLQHLEKGTVQNHADWGPQGLMGAFWLPQGGSSCTVPQCQAQLFSPTLSPAWLPDTS